MKTMKKGSNSIFALLKKTLQYANPKRKKQLVIIAFGNIVAAIAEVISLGAIAYLLSLLANPDLDIQNVWINKLLNTVGAPIADSWPNLVVLVAILAAISVGIKNILAAFVRYWSAYFSAGVMIEVSKELVDSYLYASYSSIHGSNSAERIVNVQSRWQGERFLREFFNAITDVFIVVCIIAVLLVLTTQAALGLSIIIIPAGWLFLRIVKKRQEYVVSQHRKINISATAEVKNVLEASREVKNYNAENFFIKRFWNKILPTPPLKGKQEVYISMGAWLFETLSFIALAAILGYFLFFGNESPKSVFTAISILAVAAWRLLPVYNKLLREIGGVRVSAPFLRGILDDIVRFKEKREIYPDSKYDRFEQLDFHKVSYRYPDKDQDVLKNISFSIKRGEMVGVIGHSGSGKSTLVDLLAGLLKPDTGNILLNGVSMTDIISRVIDTGFVSQFPYLFSGTLENNVMLGRNAKPESVAKLLEITKLNRSGVSSANHEVGENGKLLSGGERQRVAIMRALLNSPELLFFDEATSSLDVQTEKSIMDTILEFKGKVTMVLIAHRLSTIERCDKVIWIEDGQLVKIGKPSEILHAYSGYKK